RHWTNKEPLSVPESRSLRDFISEIKGKTSGSTYLIDMHGWEDKTIGDSHISRAFQNQFGFVNGCYDGVYQGGFLISWANSIGVRAALIELPQSCYSHSDAVNGRYLQKCINAVTNLIGGSGGSSSGGSSSSDITYISNGEVINVQSFLNVRKGPGTDYDSIGQLHQGDKVSIVAKNGTWYKIKYGSGYGYVHSDFVKNDTVLPITPEENDKDKEQAKNKAIEYVKNIIGTEIKLPFNTYKTIIDGIVEIDFKYGLNSYIFPDAAINLNIEEGKLKANNNAGNLMLMFLDIYKKKNPLVRFLLNKLIYKIEEGEISIEINPAELSIEISIASKLYENKKFEMGNKVFFSLLFKINNDEIEKIKKELGEVAKEVLDELVSLINYLMENADNVFLGVLMVVLVILAAFYLVPALAASLGVTAGVTALSEAIAAILVAVKAMPTLK
ncbi:bacteriocin, partial [Clostridium perfringens]